MSPHDLLGVEDLGDVLLGWGFFTSLPAILAIAFLAGRLLGVRRSWTTAVASGLAGWLAGTGLSLVIARSEDGAGFTRNVWLFSTFFAMSASVWIELLAKPGALARALRVLRVLRALLQHRPGPARPGRRAPRRRELTLRSANQRREAFR